MNDFTKSSALVSRTSSMSSRIASMSSSSCSLRSETASAGAGAASAGSSSSWDLRGCFCSCAMATSCDRTLVRRCLDPIHSPERCAANTPDENGAVAHAACLPPNRSKPWWAENDLFLVRKKTDVSPPQGLPPWSAGYPCACLGACPCHRARHARGPAPHAALVRPRGCDEHAPAPDCQADQAAGAAPDPPQAQAPQEAAQEEAAQEAGEEAAPEAQAEAEEAAGAAEASRAAAAQLRGAGHQLLQLPQPGQARAVGDPQPGAEDDQQHLGRAPYQHRHAPTGERLHPDRDLVLRRLGRRSRTGGRTQAWRQCADRRRQDPQPDPRRVALAAQAARPEALPAGLPAEP